MAEQTPRIRIAVFCSSSPEVEPRYLHLAFDLGVAIAQAGADLVWGGGRISMMGEVARGARSVGGHTIGVIPEHLKRIEFTDHEAGELHVSTNMRTRKAKMEELADAFITLPGSIGTLEELFEIWVGRYLGFHQYPVVILDPYDDYQSLKVALDHLAEKKFMKPGQAQAVNWTRDIESAMRIAIGE